MGKVGDDPFGTLVRLLLEQRGDSGEGLVVDRGVATAYTVVLSPQGLDRMFLHDPAANTTFCADDIRYDVVARARLFHLGYPPLLKHLYVDGGRELVEIFRRARELGVTTSLDVSLPDPQAPSGQADWRAILSRVMPYVDIFLPSAEEILFMLDHPRYDGYREASPEDIQPLVTGDDLTRLGDALLDMGGGVVGVKCGARGFYVRTAGAARRSRDYGARLSRRGLCRGHRRWRLCHRGFPGGLSARSFAGAVPAVRVRGGRVQRHRAGCAIGPAALGRDGGGGRGGLGEKPAGAHRRRLVEGPEWTVARTARRERMREESK
jgi:hypothetical protein